MSNTEVYIERLSTYTPEDAAGIGRLMPFLSDKLDDKPISETLLREIIASPHHDQLVARLDSIIVGAATLNILMGAGMYKQGYLEDFVTDPTVRGNGVGARLWDEMMVWCDEHGVDLAFTSRGSRQTAHAFYKSRAETRNTTNFITRRPR